MNMVFFLPVSGLSAVVAGSGAGGPGGPGVPVTVTGQAAGYEAEEQQQQRQHHAAGWRHRAAQPEDCLSFYLC